MLYILWSLAYDFKFIIIIICDLSQFLWKCFICNQCTFHLFLISLFLLMCKFYSHDWSILLCLIPMLSKVSKKPAARFRPGPARRARAHFWAARAAGLILGPTRRPALRPAPLKKTTKIKSIKKNIHFKILFIECIITFKNVGKVYITTK